MMKRICFCLAFAVPAAVLWACTDSHDDEVFRPTDAGAFDAPSSVDRGAPPAPDSAAAALACGDAGGAPPRVLLIQTNPRQSELAVVNLNTNTVDGRLAFDGAYGTTSSLGTDPYLLGAESDIVTRLDAREPWKAVASWDVHGDDAPPGNTMFSSADPVAVVPTSCTKAYVLRFNRNRIAVIDPSQASGGAPTKYIDLTSLRQPGDPDNIEMTSAVYVPTKKKVFVLLGNANLERWVKIPGPYGDETKLLCVPSLKPSIIAIDPDTDAVVSLGGTAPGGGIALDGYNPPIGTPLIYDAAFDRLLLLQGGCNDDVDGGPGDMIRRRVEQVDLATGTIKTLLTLDAMDFPSTLAFVSGEHAALAFYYAGYYWDPRTTALGPAIPGGMDFIARDRGGFIGTHALYLEDGGSTLQVISVPVTDAGPSVVTADPFSKPGGYIGSVEAWPQP